MHYPEFLGDGEILEVAQGDFANPLLEPVGVAGGGAGLVGLGVAVGTWVISELVNYFIYHNWNLK